MKRAIALGSLCLVVALLAALRAAETPRASRATVAALPFPDAPSPRDAAAPGTTERFSYDFSLEQSIAVEAFRPAPDLEIPGLALRSALTGRLLVRAAGGDALAFLSEGVEHAGVEGADANELMRGEVVLRAGEVQFPDGMDAGGRLLWRRLLLLWPGRLEAGTREEEDSTGIAVVSCERVSADAWVKRKVSYKEIRTSHRAFRGEAKVDGETRIEMDGLPLRVEGSETVLLRPVDGPVMRSEASFRLVRTGSERIVASAAAAGAFERLVVAPAQLAPRADPVAATERARTAVATLRVTDDRTTLEHHDALMALVGALEASDEAVREVLELLRAGGASDDLAQRLVVALAAAGSDAAQGALGEILGGAGHFARLRETAIVAALQVERPNEGIEAALVAIHRESGDAYALCALAAVGDRVRATPERFSAIERTVLRELAGARDAPGLCVALEAVGNLGPAEVPEALKTAAAHDRPDVRLAAARALLRARDPVADRLLAALLGDAEARVRAAALDAIVRRDRLGLLSPEPLPAPLSDLIAGMALNDEDQEVREFARSLAG